jgi:hypothetical protein
MRYVMYHHTEFNYNDINQGTHLKATCMKMYEFRNHVSVTNKYIHGGVSLQFARGKAHCEIILVAWLSVGEASNLLFLTTRE